MAGLLLPYLKSVLFQLCKNTYDGGGVLRFEEHWSALQSFETWTSKVRRPHNPLCLHHLIKLLDHSEPQFLHLFNEDHINDSVLGNSCVLSRGWPIINAGLPSPPIKSNCWSRRSVQLWNAFLSSFGFLPQHFLQEPRMISHLGHFLRSPAVFSVKFSMKLLSLTFPARKGFVARASPLSHWCY